MSMIHHNVTHFSKLRHVMSVYGIKSYLELSKMSGVHHVILAKMSGCTEDSVYCYGVSGELTQTAQQLSFALGCNPEELFEDDRIYHPAIIQHWSSDPSAGLHGHMSENGLVHACYQVLIKHLDEKYLTPYVCDLIRTWIEYLDHKNDRCGKLPFLSNKKKRWILLKMLKTAHPDIHINVDNMDVMISRLKPDDWLCEEDFILARMRAISLSEKNAQHQPI